MLSDQQTIESVGISSAVVGQTSRKQRQELRWTAFIATALLNCVAMMRGLTYLPKWHGSNVIIACAFMLALVFAGMTDFAIFGDVDRLVRMIVVRRLSKSARGPRHFKVFLGAIALVAFVLGAVVCIFVDALILTELAFGPPFGMGQAISPLVLACSGIIALTAAAHVIWRLLAAHNCRVESARKP